MNLPNRIYLDEVLPSLNKPFTFEPGEATFWHNGPQEHKPKGIYVTSIATPESGWPMALHCSRCGVTEFALVPWAIKPEDGDYFLIEGCNNPRHMPEIAPTSPFASWGWKG